MGVKNEVSFLLKQRESELLLLRSIQECIVLKKDVQTIFELVGNKIQEIFDSQIVMINTFDLPNEEEEIMKARYLLGADFDINKYQFFRKGK